MTRQEIENKLNELDKAEFFINMADRFTSADWDALHNIKRERNELEKMLESMN